MGSGSDHQLLIYHRHGQAYGEILAGKLPALKIHCVNRPQEAAEFIEEVEIILSSSGQIPDDLLRRAKNLVWFSSVYAGNEKLIKNPNFPKSAILTKGTSHGEAMAEYVFGYILYFGNQIAKHLENQRNRNWDRTLAGLRPGRLRGQTLGILGLGSVGQVIAQRGKQFGMNVFGMKRNPEPVAHVDQVFGPDELDKMIPLVDYLIVVLPLTQQTYHLLGEKEFSQLKEGGLLISIGRGKEIDEEGLVKELKRKRIRSVLDVFEKEPLPAESELWGMENVIITPHVSGINSAAEVCEEFLANYERWVRGEPLIGRVNRERGY